MPLLRNGNIKNIVKTIENGSFSSCGDKSKYVVFERKDIINTLQQLEGIKRKLKVMLDT
jgi:hypothetical protein